MKKTLLFTSLLVTTIVFSQAQTPATHNVSMSDFAFNPSTLTINKGDIVVWTNNTSTPHTSTSGSGCNSNGAWDSGTLNAGNTFSHTFSTAGTFPYFCTFHCTMGMTGSITVNDVNVSAVSDARSFTMDVKSFPNPFSENATLQFTLTQPGKVKLEVFDLMGKKIIETDEESFIAGNQSIEIAGNNFNQGIFICKLFYNGQLAASKNIVRVNK